MNAFVAFGRPHRELLGMLPSPYVPRRFGASCMAIALAVVVLLGVCMQDATAGDGPPTSRDGVYTKEQATAGRKLFLSNCAADCHMKDLTGSGASPALVGSEFMQRWEGMALAALLERIATTMPALEPGSLSSDEYLAILAFLLEQNHMRPGTHPLSTQEETLRAVVIEGEKR